MMSGPADQLTTTRFCRPHLATRGRARALARLAGTPADWDVGRCEG